VLININRCASPVLSQFLKIMNSKNSKTQRQGQNKFHIPGLAKGGAVLAAVVTDRLNHLKKQRPRSEDNISPRVTQTTGQWPRSRQPADDPTLTHQFSPRPPSPISSRSILYPQSDFLTETIYAHLFYPMHATCLAHLIVLHLLLISRIPHWF
jgi:hypothetical protein